MPLTTAQAAKLLSLHEKSVARAIKNGLLKASWFGRAYMIQRSDLEEYVRNHPRPSRVAHVAI